MVNEIEIDGRKIGEKHPCFVIAEAGINHNGNFEMAKQLVDIAKESQADAIKFQTAIPEKVVSAVAPKAEYQLVSTDPSQSQLDMLRDLHPPEFPWEELRNYCRERQITFLSTPFDHKSADLLESLNVPAFKMGSGEITNLPFLTHVARKGRPMIISTGMSDMLDVETAALTVRREGLSEFAMLHCVSNYPAAPSDANLRAMRKMSETIGVPIGYSDHTVGTSIALASVALGACILEKHFTLDCGLNGPDHKASLEPDKLNTMIKEIREIESGFGDGNKIPQPSEANTSQVARRSLIASVNISENVTITEDMIAILRPGTGLPPSRYSELIGLVSNQDIEKGSLINLDMFK